MVRGLSADTVSGILRRLPHKERMSVRTVTTDMSSAMILTEIFNKKSPPDQARLNLARWYNEVEVFDCMEFNRVLDTFSNHDTTIINYFEQRLTNASAESFNAKIKAFRSQLRGVADVNFFMFRLAKLYA